MSEEYNPYVIPQPPQNEQPNQVQPPNSVQQPESVQQPNYVQPPVSQQPVYRQPDPNKEPQPVYYEQITVQANREEALQLRRDRARESSAKPVLGLVFGIIGLIAFAFGVFVVISYEHNIFILRGADAGAFERSKAISNNFYNMLLLVLNVPITGTFSILALVFSILANVRHNKNKGLSVLALILSVIAVIALVFFIFFLHYKFQFDF